MSWFDEALPLLTLLSSLVPGLIIFCLPEAQHAFRTTLNLAAATVKLVFVGLMTWGSLHERAYEIRFSFVPDADLLLRSDTFSLLFASLSSVLWLATTVYAVGYLEGSPHRSRFFGFFSICVSSTMGIALAGNLLTFFVFYEMLTLSTYPLVVHYGTHDALRAGNVYLAYTLTGGVLLLSGIGMMYALVGGFDFTEGAGLARLSPEHRPYLITAFVLMVAGLGVKAALVPLHAWLPAAMVAPAPVSALLHAVAVVKAGAFGIARVIYDVYDARFAHELGVTQPLAYLAAVTIIYGSLRALFQHDLKRRLAYSTVSQVSYIVMGLAIFGTSSTIGGIAHLVHQGLMKITLFFCAGALSEELGLSDVRSLRGVGRRMPLTMAAFTVAALGMMGLPPIAGFVSKWYLGTGALASGQGWVLFVLLTSSLLNAAYFLPIVYDAWFRAPSAEFTPARGPEVSLTLLLPTAGTALLALAAGLFAGAELSPLGWAKRIADREFSQ